MTAQQHFPPSRDKVRITSVYFFLHSPVKYVSTRYYKIIYLYWLTLNDPIRTIYCIVITSFFYLVIWKWRLIWFIFLHDTIWLSFTFYSYSACRSNWEKSTTTLSFSCKQAMFLVLIMLPTLLFQEINHPRACPVWHNSSQTRHLDVKRLF